MKLFDKIKLYFTSASKIVKFIIETVGEAQALKDKKVNFRTWTEWVIAFISDALQYAQEIESLKDQQGIQTKGAQLQSAAAAPKKKLLTGQYKTEFFKEHVKRYNAFVS
jgi:hypothetical protein